MVATRNLLEYTGVMNQRKQNSVLPKDMSPEEAFNMLTFNMSDYAPVLGHGNNFKPCKQYRAPRARIKKKRNKKGGFWPMVQIN